MARPVVLMRRFDAAQLVELIVEHGVTLLSLAPTMIAMLLDDPRTDDRVLASVRTIGYGASAIPAPVLRAAVDRWDCDLSQGYGMTELSGQRGVPRSRRAPACRGGRRAPAAAPRARPAPGVELRLGEGNDEILVRAPQVMAGYWNDPEASAAALGRRVAAHRRRRPDRRRRAPHRGRPDEGRHRQRRRERRVARGGSGAPHRTPGSRTSR